MAHLPVPQRSIEIAGHMLGRGSITVQNDELVIVFTVSGPEASPRFPKQHVLLLRPGDGGKLNSRGGYGGYEDDGAAFFQWRFDWPGGAGVHVIYFEGVNRVVDREYVTLSSAS